METILLPYVVGPLVLVVGVTLLSGVWHDDRLTREMAVEDRILLVVLVWPLLVFVLLMQLAFS